jgi:hypothetical protein
LERLNTRPFQKLEGSRRSLFESLDQPALKALPRGPPCVSIVVAPNG